MTISEHFRTRFSMPIPCSNFHLVSLMSQDLPVSMYFTNSSHLQFVLDLLLISHDSLYLLGLPILVIANPQLMLCIKFLLFTNVVTRFPTYYGICAGTF